MTSDDGVRADRALRRARESLWNTHDFLHIVAQHHVEAETRSDARICLQIVDEAIDILTEGAPDAA